MQNRWLKLKAFTLSEMIVVLLVTTIVVGMAFAVLRLVQGQMQGIGADYEKNTEMNLLRQSLWVDFNCFNKIRLDPSKEVLTFFNELEEVTYEFKNGQIIKQKDTFNIKLYTTKFYFDNTPRTFGEIDAIDLQSIKEYGSQRVFVFKKNVAATYMNL